MSTSAQSWSIEHLVLAAWHRLQGRLLSYFLCASAGFGVGMAFLLGFGALGTLFLSYMSQSHSPLAAIVLFFLFTLPLALFATGLYFWFQLTSVAILTEQTPRGFVETFRSVRPRVRAYIGFSLLQFLFLLFLLPLGIVTLFTAFVLWSVWSSFSTFVFLEEKRIGLANLWASKDMINQRLLGVVGRILLLHAGMWLLTLLASSVKGNVGNVGAGLIQFLAHPFFIAFNYEMYTRLPKVGRVHPPTHWIIAGTISWFVFLLLLVKSGDRLEELQMKLQEEKTGLAPYPSRMKMKKFFAPPTLPESWDTDSTTF